MGVKFLVHGVATHILLRQKGFDLARPKSTLSIVTFYNHTLMWLPKVTERTCLGMRLNLLMFQGA
jgi:hypothetical protein